MNYTPEEKEQIKKMYAAKCERLEFSSSDAATSIGISGSTVSLVFNGKYGADDNSIFRQIARWVGFGQNQLALAETTNFRLMLRTLTEAQQYSSMYAITGEAGHGKTFAQKYYADKYKNAFYILCNEHWTINELLDEIYRQMGMSPVNNSPAIKMWEIGTRLRALDNPLLMFDEANTLKNPVMQIFKSLFNELENHCGITITATNHLTQKLLRGKQLNRLGFKEIWSRIGSRPIELLETKKNDIVKICRANGIDDEMIISRIASESEGDLRRVKRMIDKHTRTSVSLPTEKAAA
jgi:DNA transposition AAA+ family ATPase